MKKIKNKILFALVLCSVMTLSSCEDFLTQSNPNALTADLFWKNVNDLNSGLNATYNAFKNPNITSVDYESSRSDLQYPDQWRPLNDVNAYYSQTFNNSDNLVKNKWAALYNGIFRANQVINNYEKLQDGFSTDDAERALSIVAQAHALRGWFYFSLHNSFNKGALPIIDFIPETDGEFHNPMATSEEVMEFYRADLEFGLANIPLDVDEEDKGRFTRGACQALLGKSYLYEGNYAEAASRFEKVMGYGYALTPNIGSNFTTKDEFNEESILEVNYTLNLNFELTGTKNLYSNLNFIYGYGGWSARPPQSWLMVAFRNDPVDQADAVNTVSYTDEDGNVTTKFRRFSLRTTYSVALVDDDAPGVGYYGGEYPITSPANFGRTRPVYWRKFTNWDIIDSERNLTPPNTARSGVNLRLIRLADVYLMYAECMLETGNLDEALMYINKVRKRSHITLLGDRAKGEFDDVNTTYDNDRPEADRLYANIYDAAVLREHLRHLERPLELGIEGNAIRNIDLRRWGVKKQRFEDLASRHYNTHNMGTDYLESTVGKHKTQWKCIVTEYVEGNEDESSPNYIPPFHNVDAPMGVATYKDPQFDDSQEAAQNYNEERHAYLPIPLSEINSNLGLKE